MNNKRSRQNLTEPSNQTLSKKIKTSPIIPNYLNQIKNIHQREQLCGLFEKIEQINDIDVDQDEDDLKDYHQNKKAIEKYTLAEKICAVIFYEDLKSFPVYFQKCLQDLVNKIRLKLTYDIDHPHPLEFYLIYRYDYENQVKKDFSFKSFSNQMKFGDHKLISLIQNQNKQQMQETLVQLLQSWIEEGDIESMSIVIIFVVFCKFSNNWTCYKIQLSQHSMINV